MILLTTILLMFNKTRHKGKKYFCNSCLQCFSSEIVLNDHKKDCLLINGSQNVKLEKGFIEFKNFNRQISVPFKIYADFECLLKNCDSGINNDCFSYTSKYQEHILQNIKTIFLVVLLINWCVLTINSVKILRCTEEKNAVFKFIQYILKEYHYCKDVIKKHFNKNLVMTAEENEEFERSNICWICGGLIDIGDNKVRDHCHITGKYRRSAHGSCNINLKICNKLVVIFYKDMTVI